MYVFLLLCEHLNTIELYMVPRRTANINWRSLSKDIWSVSKSSTTCVAPRSSGFRYRYLYRDIDIYRYRDIYIYRYRYRYIDLDIDIYGFRYRYLRCQEVKGGCGHGHSGMGTLLPSPFACESNRRAKSLGRTVPQARSRLRCYTSAGYPLLTSLTSFLQPFDLFLSSAVFLRSL